jgi:chain length determinant protein EpsF
MAADIANAFAQAAIDTNIELKIEPAKQYAAWFADRSRALRQNLEAKQKALSDFQNLNGIVATDEKLDVETARLTELSTELVNIQGERQDSQSRQRQVTGDNDSLPEVMQSPLIAALKNSLSDAEAKRADIAGTLGKNHPDYQAADAEVTALRTKLTEETNKIAASLGSTTRVNVRRENDIKEALEAQKKKVLELKHQHDKAAVLESDVQTAQRDLDAVTQRFAESSLESQTHQTNLVQLTTAVEPVEPSSPKWLLVLIVGMFVGAVGGVLAALVIEFKNPLVRHESEFEMLLGLPLLAKVPTMKSTGAGNASISSGLLEAPGT